VVRTVEGILTSYSTIDFFGYTFNVPLETSQLRDELERNLSSLAGRSANILIGFASSFASGLLWLVVILVTSFYLLKDADKIRDYLYCLMPPDYRDELWALGGEISHIWNDFLRGQLVLCVVVGTAVGFSLWVIGLRNALILGILAGVLEIVPNLGPALSSVPAILIALLQGSNRLAISNVWFALLVAGLYVFIQQVENNYLVPRIIGRSVNLHPVVVLLGVVAGANLAGILGIFLAAPTMATVRVLARYAYAKVLDEEVQIAPPLEAEPTQKEEPEQPEQQPAEAVEATALDTVGQTPRR
jgi:predicted PurR-regulated permease PerM